MSPYLGSSAITAAGGLTSNGLRQFVRPGGADLRALQQETLRQAEAAEERLPALLQEIRATAMAANPLLTYSRLTVLTSMRRALPGPANFGSDAVLEFYGGLVTEMPVDDVVARLGADYHPQALYDLDRLLREYAMAANQVHEAKALRIGPRDSLTSVRNLLEFEQRFDRMLGYPEQLRPIFKAIVEPLADKSRSLLGSPSVMHWSSPTPTSTSSASASVRSRKSFRSS